VFTKIHGHKNTLSSVSQDIINGKLEGVYLFKGTSSVGKYTTARLVGKYLTCIGLQDDTCRCENCRLFPHVPDYFEVSKADTITVGDVQPLSDFFSLVPYRSRSRVAVIDNAHNLNLTSSNNLLKVLEEIPKGCTVILVTDSPERLLDTVLSRCYHISFDRLRPEEIREILKNMGHNPNKISDIERMIPYLSGGVLSNFPRYVAYVELVSKFLKDIVTLSEDEIVSEVKEIAQRDDTDIFIDVLLIFLNDLLKLRYGSPDVVFNVKNIDYLEELTEFWKEDLCIYMIDRLRNVQLDMKKRINLKEGQLLLPSIMWAYYFLHKKS